MSSRYYLVMLATITLAISVLVHVMGLFRNTFGCDARGQRNDEYVAYCANSRYTDYEHGALFYDNLEPRAIAAMKTAQILFFGNSRSQVGIDTELLAARLGDARFYMLGFGHSEKYQFPLALLERHKLHPHAVIINADPFFEKALSQPARALLETGFGEPYLSYLYRRTVLRVKAKVCDSRKWLDGSHACANYNQPIFRNRATGAWRLTLPVYDGKPVERAAPDEDAAAKEDGYVANAREFLRATGVPAECVFVVNLPSSFDSGEAAPRIADAVGVQYLAIDAGILTSYDNSHLTVGSARRWTEALLDQLQPRLKSCIDPTPRAEGAVR